MKCISKSNYDRARSSWQSDKLDNVDKKSMK